MEKKKKKKHELKSKQGFSQETEWETIEPEAEHQLLQLKLSPQWN